MTYSPKYVVSTLLILSCVLLNAQTITGELKKWHKVSLAFDGPNLSETASPNPFTDYRLNVTFSNGSTTYTVPGYFAADGDAAETSASSGNQWLVHFAPDQIGTWTYTASFRQGTDIALDLSPTAGTSAGFMDGTTGSFSIANSDKTGRDHRATGRLKYVGEHYLQYQETGTYFLKMGSDAPENTLAYEDFDEVPNRGGRRKNWNPHAADYTAEGDAYTWQGGKGSELMGVINYLHDKGMNVISFLTLSLHGDDENVFPHLLKVPVSTYNGYGDAQQWTDGVYHDRFDVSRMAQWERIFEYADKKGMYLHFKTLETENDNIMDGDAFGRERKVYYRELVARFSHHLALNWNLSEEITLTESVINQTADYIKAIDPYNHIVVFHTYPGQKNKYTAHLGPANSVDGASLQTSNATYNEVRSDVLNWLTNSANAGKKWVVAVDEPGNASIGVDSDPNDIDLVRNKVVWNILMAGGAGAEFYYGYQSGCGDLACQDHRTRDAKYTDAAIALDFFHTHLPFHEMSEMDNLTAVTDDYVFAKADEIYSVYLPSGGTTAITLPTGDWDVQWFNPRTGGNLSTRLLITGNSISAPDNNDWVALIRPSCSTSILFVRGGAGTGGFLEGGADEQLADITDYSTNGGNHGWGEFADVLTGEGYTLVQMIEGSNIPLDLAAMDLSQYASIVFGSNNADYSTASIDALEAYVRAGGSALFISDANFGSSWQDASNSDQGFLDRFGWTMNQDNGTYSISSAEFLEPSHPILQGVSSFDGEGVTPITLTNTNVSGVTSTILTLAENQVRRNPGNGQGPTEPVTNNDASLIVASVDAGRIAGHFDRNTFFNLNGAGTNINNQNNTQYAINLINWLADCDANCIVGDPCDDNDPCTNNDAYDANCDCIGLSMDDDNDGVCNNLDQCPNFDNALIGTACDDLNVCTVNDVYTTNCLCEGSIPAQGSSIELTPTDDAYLQGTTSFNNNIIRVENNNRTGYFKFDIPVISGTLISANLILTVDSDPGNGTVTIYDADSNNWTETTLNNTNKPNEVNILSSLNTTYANGQEYTWSIPNNSINTGAFTLVMKHLSGNDVAFASKDNTNASIIPTLVLEIEETNNTIGMPCDDGDACTLNDTITANCECIGSLIDVNNNDICDTDECLEIGLSVCLEGAYDVLLLEMNTKLNLDRGVLPGQTPSNNVPPTPAGQPYHTPPWNYTGTEGANWTDADYDADVVDWLLISFREETGKNTEIAQAAAILNKDGSIEFPNCPLLNLGYDSLYVVIEHRNHMGVMSPFKIPITVGQLNYDFRLNDSYKNPTSSGQKNLSTGVWAMFAGDGNQEVDISSYDINGEDKSAWLFDNGNFGVYNPNDLNMDGDVNGNDKAIWTSNNGLFSTVPK